jgi:hypothetical protein
MRLPGTTGCAPGWVDPGRPATAGTELSASMSVVPIAKIDEPIARTDRTPRTADSIG